FRGEFRLHQNRRGAVGLAAAAIDDEAAVLERGDAYGRAGAAAGEIAELLRRDGEALDLHDGRADGEGELRARAEAGMSRDGAVNLNSVAALETQGLGAAFQKLHDALALGPSRLELLGRRGDDLGFRRVHREPNRAVAPPEAAVQVEKAEMQ